MSRGLFPYCVIDRTPGPVVITVAFIGYLVARPAVAAVAAFAVVMMRFKKVPEPIVILAAACAGFMTPR